MSETGNSQGQERWLGSMRGTRAAVLGMSVTGFAAADTLVDYGAQVLALGRDASPERLDMLEALGVRWQPVEHDGDEVAALEAFAPQLIVVSPGFPPRHPAVRWAMDAGVPLWTDIDLAWKVDRDRGRRTRWLAVTGTNGKTTTVRLAAAMAAAGGLRAVACGNIGVSPLDPVREPEPYDVLVVELSSFQLHYLRHDLSPWASVCLNAIEDHIDWHGSREAYVAAKARVYERTQVACVYNSDEPNTRRMVEEADVVEGARAIGFTQGVPAPGELGIVDDVLVDRAFTPERSHAALELATRADLAARGLDFSHLRSDVLAAAALARSLGVAPAAIREAVVSFHLDPHRIQQVAEVDGVRWIDDSKATNAHAARVSLSEFPHVVWIVGGVLKGTHVAPLVREARERLRGAVVVGVDRREVLDAFEREAPEVPVREVIAGDGEDVMTVAVSIARDLALSGDAVLLAPAAASWDQYNGYALRGDAFQRAVLALRSYRSGGQ